MTETTKILLKKVPLFTGISEDIFNSLGDAVQELNLSDGEILFKEGDTGTSIYIIKSGQIEILKSEDESGKQVRLAMRSQGDFFGEMSLLEDSPRFASAKAVGKCVVLELSRAKFNELILKNPQIALDVLGVMSSRLRQSDLQMIHDLEQKNKQLETTNMQLKETADKLESSNQSLLSANKFLEKIISASTFFIIVTDKNGRIFIFNEAARGVFGRQFKDVAGKPVDALFANSIHQELLEDMEKSIAMGDTWAGDILTQRSDGSKLFVELVGARVFDDQNEIFATLYMGRDVTEEKNVERQMILLERMATRGEMAAEIAHELNNYLSIVLGNLELLQMELNIGKTDKAEAKIESMKNGLDKITRFTDGLMMYSRPASKKEEFDLHNFLDNELFFIKPQNRFDEVEFKCEFQENLPIVTADKSQIQQALLNLLNNAADATSANEGDRTITIRTKYDDETKTVAISVIDNGVGLNQDSYDRVFKQHFTTKERGHGFGLLAVKRVIKSHGGRVEAANLPDGGAMFTISFPVKPDSSMLQYA